MNKIKQAQLALVAGLSAVGTGAMAAVPADVTTALGTIGADALTVAAVVLVAIVSIYAFKFLRKGL